MIYPFIVILCYIIVTLIKRTSLAKEWMPLLSACTGAVLAVIGFCALPQLVTADSFITAAFNGAISGLAATGGNQVVKQSIKLFCKQHGLEYHVVKDCAPTNETDVLESDCKMDLVCTIENKNDPANNKNDPANNKNDPANNKNDPANNKNDPANNKNDPANNKNE